MSILMLEDGSDALLEDAGDILLEEDTLTLNLLPFRVRKSATTVVAFTGSGTAWLSGAPTFTPAGAPSADPAWHMGAVQVISNTLATVAITTGAIEGDVTFTDSTTSATAVLTVGLIPAIVMLRPAATRLYRRN